MPYRIIGDRKPSKVDPSLAERLNEEEKLQARKVVKEKPRIIMSDTQYRIVNSWCYNKALKVLNEQCNEVLLERKFGIMQPALMNGKKTLFLPLTLEQTMLAKVEQYNSRPQHQGDSFADQMVRLALWSYDLDTGTGIAYKAGTTKFKILNWPRELVVDNKGQSSVIAVEYDSFEGVEIDYPNMHRNEMMNKEAALAHEGWNALIADRNLLNEYIDIMFKEKAYAIGFFVYFNHKQEKDVLFHTCLKAYQNDGDFNGNHFQDGNTTFAMPYKEPKGEDE